MRKAVQDLVRGGMLVQRHGSGTFVAPRVKRVEQSLSRLTSFTEDMARRGMTVRSEWLDRGLYPPSPDEMMALGLSPSEQVARVARLRIADDTPLAIERASLSAARAARSAGDRRVALRRAGKDRQPAGARRAAHLGGQSRRRGCRLLGCRAGVGEPHIERISYLASGKVIEFTRSIYRGDAYDFVVELQARRQDGRRTEQDVTDTTHMRREIVEIPDAAARLLDASDGALAAAGAASARAVDPRYRDHGRARLVRPCRGVPEICRRADGRRAGRLARAVDRLDLRREAQARRLGLPGHLAIGQEPGHRRHGASGAAPAAR